MVNKWTWFILAIQIVGGELMTKAMRQSSTQLGMLITLIIVVLLPVLIAIEYCDTKHFYTMLILGNVLSIGAILILIIKLRIDIMLDARLYSAVNLLWLPYSVTLILNTLDSGGVNDAN